MNNLYDVVIIGSGPGGYVSAIRSSQLGFRTALIEKNRKMGGTCLNVGCIPSKSLLESSKHFFLAKENYHSHGIFFDKLSFDFQKMMERKNRIIQNLNKGLEFLMKKNKIDIYKGIGSFETKNTLSVKDYSSLKEQKKIHFKFCIISTGSYPTPFPGINFNNKKNIFSSNDLLNIQKIPNKMIIIGGGIIGLEFGSIFSRLGSKITIVDSMDNILSNMDPSISQGMKNILGKHMDIKTSISISDIFYKKEKIYIIASYKNKPFTIEGDCCLISIGRNPYTKYLDLENIGIKKDDKGFIIVNDYFQTSVKNIYAIGDVIGGKMLAHKAEEEGLHVLEHISGKFRNTTLRLNNYLIPSVVYTYPEAASIGYTENEIIEKNIKYNIGIFPMKSLGRAQSIGCTDGFVKMITEKKTDEILGIHIIGDHAGDLIMEGAVAMSFYASSEDIYKICHPHPTLSEAFKEVSLLNFENRAIHM
ncbi:dihydrolipoyl dehydrogenase [Blattabacterium cuenoti]|uniref:dihydrolipoyl dehydrogenase n=1 Tax=Blattabacterium cuenoti TaxID=1653831 RepID=UPI00163BAFF7|nr:dihydrolipoyl dehydrogenase [Blattabacterium cuenoti]